MITLRDEQVGAISHGDEGSTGATLTTTGAKRRRLPGTVFPRSPAFGRAYLGYIPRSLDASRRLPIASPPSARFVKRRKGSAERLEACI